jgi:hypothetical protein
MRPSVTITKAMTICSLRAVFIVVRSAAETLGKEMMRLHQALHDSA